MPKLSKNFVLYIIAVLGREASIKVQQDGLGVAPPHFIPRGIASYSCTFVSWNCDTNCIVYHRNSQSSGSYIVYHAGLKKQMIAAK